MDDSLKRKGVPSKIEKYDLMSHATNLLKVIPKMSYNQVAQELNAIGDIPDEEKITSENVSQFAKKYPEVRKEVMLANKAHLRKTVLEGAEFDMLGQLRDMATRLSFMLQVLEDEALDEGTIPSGKEYKAFSSEFRETLKQIESIHKEIYDMEVVREFMLEVVKVLQEVSPEALSVFVAKMKGKRENSHIVNELLSGGIK